MTAPVLPSIFEIRPVRQSSESARIQNLCILLSDKQDSRYRAYMSRIYSQSTIVHSSSPREGKKFGKPQFWFLTLVTH